MASRKDLLGQEFIVAGTRGLTGRQMRNAVGDHWRRRLYELKCEGWMFREEPKRFGVGVFRWVLIYVPAVEDQHDGPEQTALPVDGGRPRPVSALEPS